METTKLTVEYLIVGILICLAIIFLVFNIAPWNMDGLTKLFLADPSILSASLIIIIFLPISYGVGLVAEYVGLVMYEGLMRKVKKARFPIFIEANLDWITKSPLLEKYVRKDQPVPDDAGEKSYGEMRFYVLMNNAALYAEIESHINQARIIRVLSLAEVIFILGFVAHVMKNGLTSFSSLGILLVAILLIFTFKAIKSRFDRYCRAIERSFKVLSQAEINKK
jgi:hypothetical protein